MTRAELLTFLRRHTYAVEATVSPSRAPQAAVIGIAVTDALEIVFDTLDSTRKLQNLRQDARIALVIGWDEAQTVQLEGIADIPTGEALAPLQAIYLARFPDGHDRLAWPGLVYVRVRPTWIRYSDYREAEPRIVTFEGATLQA